jgi:hypothetical protein
MLDSWQVVRDQHGPAKCNLISLRSTRVEAGPAGGGLFGTDLRRIQQLELNFSLAAKLPALLHRLRVDCAGGGKGSGGKGRAQCKPY